MNNNPKSMNMRPVLLLMIFSIFITISCDSPATRQKKETIAENNLDTKNFVVVWQILTDDHEFVLQYLPKQAEEFNELFAKGTIENAYLNNVENVQLNNEAALTTVVFILKAKSLEAAEGIVDQMIFVRNKVASYRIHPVGGLWFGRKNIEGDSLTSSFATIWQNNTNRDTVNRYEDRQATELLDIWHKGIVENAYYAVEDAQERDGAIPGMMFFVNAPSEAEARAICDGFLYSKKGIATYTIHPVGNFWQGNAQ
jgi:hypothetical protein